MKKNLLLNFFIFGCLLTAGLSWPAFLTAQNVHHHALTKPEANIKLEIIPIRNVDTKIIGQKRVDVKTNIPQVVFNPNYRVDKADPESMARQYLNDNAGELLLQESAGNLEYKNVVETPGGYHVHFIQTENGYPVYGSDLNVTISRSNEVLFFANGYQKIGNIKADVRKSTINAIQLSRNYLKLNEESSFEKVETVVYKIDEKKSVLAHKVNIVPANSHFGDWEILVDAGTGEIIRVEDKACYFMPDGDTVTGSGVVFDPDPVTAAATTYGYTGFLDNNDADHDSLTAQLDTVSLNNITWNGSDYKLIGPYAEIVDSESPYTGLFGQSTKYFHYNRSQIAFEATNVYCHVDRSMRYLNETLGFSVMPFQYSGGVRFDPHGLGGGVNAHYVGSTGQIAFGSPSGRVDLGEDQAVIIHELGHAIHDYITAGNLSQVNGLSEGLSDYWAQSYARSLGIYEPSDPQYNYFGSWGGQAWSGNSLRVTNYTAHYPEGLVGQVHTDGQMWSSSLMTIYDSIGRTATDMNCWEAISMLNSSSSQVDAALAFVEADKLLYNGANLDVIADVFYNRGYIASNWAVNIDFTSDVNGGETPLDVQFTDLSVALVSDINSWEWDFDNDGQIDSYLENPNHTYTEKGTYTVSLKVSNGANDSTIVKTNFISVNSGILVFETDENIDDHSGTFIKDFLEPLGYDVSYTNYFPSDFNGFDAVFLSMGNYGGTRTILTDDMATSIIDYLETGGNVFLEGGDPLGWDQRHNLNLHDMFGLDTIHDGSTNSINGLAGNTGTLTEGISFNNSNQNNTTWIDIFYPYDNSNIAFTESAYGTVATQYAGSFGQKTFCFSYALAELTDVDSISSRETVMYRLLDFFDLTVSSDTTEPESGVEPIAHWPLDEGTGTYAEDVTVNLNDGTLINGPVWSGGNNGGALNFDGVNDRVDCGNGNELDMGSGDFSISTWLKMGSDQNTYPTIVGKGAGASYDQGYNLCLRNGKLRLSIADGTKRTDSYSDPVTLTNDQWHHIAVTIDRDGDAKFYVDGDLEGFNDITVHDGYDIASAKSLTIGSMGTSSSRFFKGNLDDIRLYDVALTNAEVGVLANDGSEPNNPPILLSAATIDPDTLYLGDVALAEVSASDPDGDPIKYLWSKVSGSGQLTFTPNNTVLSYSSTVNFSSKGNYMLKVEIYDFEDTISSTVGIVVLDTNNVVTPVAHWPMNEGAGGMTEDVTIHDNDGILLGDASWVPGIDGNGLSFDGNGDRVDAGTGTELDMGTGDFSVSTWVKMGTDQNSYPTIIGKGAGASYDQGYHLLLKSGKIRFSIADGTIRSDFYSDAVAVMDDQWHHLAVTVDRSSDVVFYLDGDQVGSSDVSVHDGENIVSSKSLTVGSWMTNTSRYLTGELDDLRLYQVALTEYVVDSLFNLYSAYKTSQLSDATSTIGQLAVYPNPFSTNTTFEFSLGIDQHINISVYDMHGNRVAVLRDEKMLIGKHRLIWNGMSDGSLDLSHGMYILRIVGEHHVEQKTIVKMR